MHSELNIQKDLFSGEDKNLKPIKINNSIFNITRLDMLTKSIVLVKPHFYIYHFFY